MKKFTKARATCSAFRTVPNGTNLGLFGLVFLRQLSVSRALWYAFGLGFEQFQRDVPQLLEQIFELSILGDCMLVWLELTCAQVYRDRLSLPLPCPLVIGAVLLLHSGISGVVPQDAAPGYGPV